MIRKNDYVKYLGDYSTMDPIRREDCIAQVKDIIEKYGYTYVILHLLDKNIEISCSINLIRPISTEVEHLKKLGFKEVSEKDKTIYFQSGNFIISSIGISFPNISYMFASGMCMGNLRHFSSKDVEKYVIDNKFSPSEFNKDFPSVHNINQLISELKNAGWDYDFSSLLR